MGSGLISVATGACDALQNDLSYEVHAESWVWMDQEFCKDQPYFDYSLGNELILNYLLI